MVTMRQQEAQQVERLLRQNWQEIRYQLLDQFAGVNTSDLDTASTVDDLVQRLADRSHYSEGYVENRLRQLVGVAAGPGPAAAPEAERPAEGQPAAEQPAERFGGQPFAGS